MRSGHAFLEAIAHLGYRFDGFGRHEDIFCSKE